MRIEVFELMRAGEMYAAVQSIGAEQEVRLPNVGGVSTAGKSLDQLEHDVRDRLLTVLKDPVVTVLRQSRGLAAELADGRVGTGSSPVSPFGTRAVNPAADSEVSSVGSGSGGGAGGVPTTNSD